MCLGFQQELGKQIMKLREEDRVGLGFLSPSTSNRQTRLNQTPMD